MRNDPARLPAHLAFVGKTKADRVARKTASDKKGEKRKRGDKSVVDDRAPRPQKKRAGFDDDF